MRCSPKARRVIAPAGKATIRPENASTSTQRSPTREIALACHGKVASFHRTFQSRARPILLIGATWLSSSNSESYTTSSRRNSNGCNNYDKLWRGRLLAKQLAINRGARAKARDVQRHIEEDVDAAEPPIINRASQSLATAALLLCTMPEPSTTEGRRIHEELRGLLECAAVQQAESPPQAIRWGPLASRGKPRCTPRIPERGHPWCTIVSETTVSPRQFMIVSADAPDNKRRPATALGEADATTPRRTEAPPPSRQDLRSLARPSAEHRSRLGSEPRLLSPNTQGIQSRSSGLLTIDSPVTLGGRTMATSSFGS
jgi:hypothetical protein